MMFRRRALMTLAVVTALSFVQALPAHADGSLKKKKSTSVNGRSGSAAWYRSGDTNWMKVTAEGGSNGKCTEVWWDYATKPHQHYNPGVFVNCSGSTRTLSKAHVVKYFGIRGFQLIVCEVPKTSGAISRTSKNCKGDLGGLYLHSGQKYSRFSVKAMRFPSGIVVYR
jgi:hypothetical protein